MKFITAIWGEEKSHKTSTALTWPKPIVHFDIDVGGYSRAAWRLETTGIVSKPYIIQVGIEELIGVDKSSATIRFPKRVVGYRECWEQLVTDYIEACRNPEVKTIVFDSATQLWQICHKNELQIKQEIQLSKNPRMADSELRERLQPIEFPNDRMRSLIYTARSYGKYLVLTHYPRDIYVERSTENGTKEVKSGEQEIDGFKETERLVDVVIRNEWKSVTVSGKRTKELVSTITRCGLPGLGTTATGLPLSESSFQGLCSLAESMGAKLED